ncbi:MAG: hypothetical protein LBK96_00660 [Prevotellaceae bacterium]|jgi:hypothetical protein|nr:hypothetical protein [Prevotellaceae bacterium]
MVRLTYPEFPDRHPELPDHDPETSDRDPETSDHDPETSDHDPETSDSYPEFPDRRPLTYSQANRLLIARLVTYSGFCQAKAETIQAEA